MDLILTLMHSSSLDLYIPRLSELNHSFAQSRQAKKKAHQN